MALCNIGLAPVTWLVFRKFEIISNVTAVSEQPKRKNTALNVMAILRKRQ